MTRTTQLHELLAQRATIFMSYGFLFVIGLPDTASAHVKWCTITNVHETPVALHSVLSTIFLTVLAGFTLMVLLGFSLDGWVVRRWPKHLSSGPSRSLVEDRLIRAAAGAYFIYASIAGTMILTPELTTRATWIPVVQFLIAMFLIWRPTCLMSGLGILVLYVDAVRQYGLFHLTDYVFLLCLAIYLGLLSLPTSALTRVREPLLVGGLAFSLAWTAIEKFLYPQWTDAVIAMHPSIGLGLPNSIVVVVAGFVEFTLAFYLVTGRGLLRLGGAGYALIFIAAMPPFGKIDVFGHLVVIATLGLVVLGGTTLMQKRVHLAGRGIAVDAAWITVLYLASLGLFFAAYYTMQRT